MLPQFGDLLTMVTNHLLNGMILQDTPPKFNSLPLKSHRAPKAKYSSKSSFFQGLYVYVNFRPGLEEVNG